MDIEVLSCTIDIGLNMYVYVIKFTPSLASVTAVVNGTTTTFIADGETIKVTVDITLGKELPVIIKDGSTTLLTIYNGPLTLYKESIVSDFNLCEKVTVIDSFEVKQVGENIFYSFEYDRGFNDGLVLGQMI